jgi:hypothetical protein
MRSAFGVEHGIAKAFSSIAGRLERVAATTPRNSAANKHAVARLKAGSSGQQVSSNLKTIRTHNKSGDIMSFERAENAGLSAKRGMESGAHWKKQAQRALPSKNRLAARRMVQGWQKGSAA